MQLAVSHLTTFRYAAPVASAIQLVRLTPRRHDGLSVLRWRVRGAKPAILPSFVDGHGNLVHTNSINRPHQTSTILAEGVVETRAVGAIVRGAAEPLPPVYFLRLTPPTTADAAVAELAAAGAPGAAPLDRLRALLELVRRRVAFRTQGCEAAAGASEALARGFGTAQDQAHLFISACRLIGVAARYVSGYRLDGDGGACHAWTEAFIADLGWMAFDPATASEADETYIRVAVGLDSGSAAPLRSVRRGEAGEELSVTVAIAAAESAQ